MVASSAAPVAGTGPKAGHHPLGAYEDMLRVPVTASLFGGIRNVPRLRLRYVAVCRPPRVEVEPLAPLPEFAGPPLAIGIVEETRHIGTFAHRGKAVLGVPLEKSPVDVLFLFGVKLIAPTLINSAHVADALFPGGLSGF